jgi:asparagine synthase (glutamine-hydrolysing)
MCGICGIVSSDPQEQTDAATILRMRDTLIHRGPDDCGIYLGPGVALGHRRLSIIDLRPEGRQPMSNEDGSVKIVFNGEIYNFAEHRAWLEERGHRFKSRTDTEVIIHLYEELGVDCLRRLRGMFAFAIWDERKRLLFMARDRIGKKPLFYRLDGRRLIFGSQPKAILAFGGHRAEPNAQAIDKYLAFGFVPAPLCAFEGVQKIPPAHYLVFENGKIEVKRYWRLNYRPKLKIDQREACAEIIRRLTEAVQLRMVSDVPLGAFLSGGIDSSAVVALMSRLSNRPVKTFSIGFKEGDYDETRYARMVAQKFHTEHHEFQVEPDALEVMDELVSHYNEPFADSSALPTYYLSKLTRQHVTVALNGDAGDENFGGYYRYSANLMANYLKYAPRSIRRLIGNSIAAAYNAMNSQSRLAHRMRVLGDVLASDPRLGYAEMLTSFGRIRRASLYSSDFADQLLDSESAEDMVLGLYTAAQTDQALDSTLYVDVNLYLPDDLLVKVDIASMAVSLEARSPMVDHEFMEFAASLPASFKIRGRTRKWILRRAFADILPREILERKKMGFGVPIEHWFRGQLRDYISDILLSATSLQRGYFQPNYIKRLIDEHASGARKWHGQLWTLLMLELWFQKFVDSAVSYDFTDQQAVGR